MMVLYITNLL